MRGKTTSIRYRQSGALAIAAGLAIVGALPLATARWWLLPVLLIPLGVAVWAARAGTDASPSGLTVRALFGARRIPWSEITELHPDGTGRVHALLTDGTVIRLAGVPARAIPDLLAAGSQTLDRDES